MGTLVVVRHAQASLFARDYDELSEHGIAQALSLGRHWAATDEAFTRVITGPAKRHRDTWRHAQAAAGADARLVPEGHGAATVMPGFDEHDAFALVAKSLPQLEPANPQIRELAVAARETKDPGARSLAWQRLFEAIMHLWLGDDLKVEGVESWPQFNERVDQACTQLLDEAAHAGPKQRILLVTSVGPSAALLHRATGASPRRAFAMGWRQRNASISRFVFSGARMTLDAFNALPHLEAKDVTFR